MDKKYPHKELDSLEKRAQKTFQKIQSEMFAEIRASLSVDDFKKAFVEGEPLVKAAKGSQRANHKYILRTGSPGNYNYYYFENGQLRFKNDFSKDVDKFKKEHGDIPFVNGFNHPEPIKDLFKQYPDVIPNKGTDAKIRDHLKGYLDNLRRASNISQNNDDRIRIMNEIKTLKGRFLTGEDIKTVTAKRNNTKIVTAKPSFGSVKVIDTEPKSTFTGDVKMSDKNTGEVKETYTGDIKVKDDGVKESQGGVKVTDAGSGEAIQNATKFEFKKEASKIGDRKQYDEYNEDSPIAQTKGYLNSVSQSKASTEEYNSTTDLNLVGETRFGLASPETQQALNSNLNVMEQALQDAGLGKMKVGVTYFCGQVENARGGVYGKYYGSSRSIQIMNPNKMAETVTHETFHAIDDALTTSAANYRSDVVLDSGRGNPEIRTAYQEMFKVAEKSDFMEMQFDRLNEAKQAADELKGTEVESQAKGEVSDAEQNLVYQTMRTEIFARLGEVYMHGKVKEMMDSGAIDKQAGQQFIDQFQPDLWDKKSGGTSKEDLQKTRAKLEQQQLEADVNGDYKMSNEIDQKMSAIDREINHGEFGAMTDAEKSEMYQSIKPHMELILSSSKVQKALLEAGIIVEPLVKAGSIFAFIKNTIKKAYLKTLIVTLGLDALSKDEKDFIRQDLGLSRNIMEEAYQMGAEDRLADYDRSEAKSFIKKMFKSLDERVVDIVKNSRNEDSARNKLEKLSKTAQWSYQVITTDQMTRSFNEGRIDFITENSEAKDPLVYCLGPLDSATSDECKKHYHKNGSFKVYRLSELQANGRNDYLKRNQWKAVVPPMHPNCRHVLVELPSGWSLDAKGQAFFVSPDHNELDNNLMKKSLKGKTPTYSGWRLHKRYKFQGMNISIENQKGSYRKWRDVNGTEGKTKMLYDYGYIRNTLSAADGDHVDCYIGPNEDAVNVYVIHQVRVDTGKFDEDKVMLGFDSAKEAKEAYLAHYNSNKFFGSMDQFTIEAFKKKVLGKEVRMIKSEDEYVRRDGKNYWYYDKKKKKMYSTNREGHVSVGGDPNNEGNTASEHYHSKDISFYNKDYRPKED